MPARLVDAGSRTGGLVNEQVQLGLLGSGFVKEENRIVADTAIAEFLTKYLLG